MKKNIQTSVIKITCVLLVVLFAYTGASKLLDRWSFELVLGASPLVGKQNAFFVSWLVPISELTIVLFLMIPSLRLLGLVASFLVLFLFSGYIAYLLLSGSVLPCSCGGVIASMGWKEHLVFNLAFWMLSGVSLYFQYDAKDFIAINRDRRKPVETSRQLHHL